MMNRMSYKSAVLVTALLACTVSGAAGPDGSPEVIRPLSLRQIALFQNGLAFFVGEAALPAGTTSGRFALPAAPSEGTF